MTVVIDLNGLQGFGTTREVASMEDLGRRMQGFGIEVCHVDGHDHLAIVAAAIAHPGALIGRALRSCKKAVTLN